MNILRFVDQSTIYSCKLCSKPIFIFLLQIHAALTRGETFAWTIQFEFDICFDAVSIKNRRRRSPAHKLIHHTSWKFRVVFPLFKSFQYYQETTPPLSVGWSNKMPGMSGRKTTVTFSPPTSPAAPALPVPQSSALMPRKKSALKATSTASPDIGAKSVTRQSSVASEKFATYPVDHTSNSTLCTLLQVLQRHPRENSASLSSEKKLRLSASTERKCTQTEKSYWDSNPDCGFSKYKRPMTASVIQNSCSTLKPQDRITYLHEKYTSGLPITEGGEPQANYHDHRAPTPTQFRRVTRDENIPAEPGPSPTEESTESRLLRRKPLSLSLPRNQPVLEVDLSSLITISSTGSSTPMSISSSIGSSLQSPSSPHLTTPSSLPSSSSTYLTTPSEDVRQPTYPIQSHHSSHNNRSGTTYRRAVTSKRPTRETQCQTAMRSAIRRHTLPDILWPMTIETQDDPLAGAWRQQLVENDAVQNKVDSFLQECTQMKKKEHVPRKPKQETQRQVSTTSTTCENTVKSKRIFRTLSEEVQSVMFRNERYNVLPDKSTSQKPVSFSEPVFLFWAINVINEIFIVNHDYFNCYQTCI